MRERVLEDEWYYCHHISGSDERDISGFKVKHPEFGQGLAEYLTLQAMKDEKASLMRTYLVRSIYTDELVGYFSLKSGMVSINESEEDRSGIQRVYFDTLPGVELANFAVDQRFAESHPNHRSIGIKIFRNFVRKIITYHSESIGIAIIYIFALPHDSLLYTYEKVYGFFRLSTSDQMKLHNRIKPRYDEGCIFMYQLV